MAKTYRIGIIGRTGRGDYGHAVDMSFLQLPNCQVVGVADDDAMGLAAAAQRLKVEATFRDYREMLDKTKPDIVAICQRWVDQHREMILAAAERGIHVYMEKPCVRSLDDADAVVAACERSHVKLAVAHPTRYSPRLAKIKELIAAGAIGKVLEFRGRGKEDRRGGGEDLWVLGSHVMDMIRALAGHPEWCFAEVTQDGQPIRKEHVVEGNEGLGPLAGDAIAAMYGLSGGAKAYFQSVRNAAGKPSRYGLVIYGSTGAFEIQEGMLSTMRYLGDGGWGRGKAVWKEVTSAGIDQPEPLVAPLENDRHAQAILDLISAIENDRQPLCGVYEARGLTEMIIACFESQRLGKPVKLPLENRQHPLTMLS